MTEKKKFLMMFLKIFKTLFNNAEKITLKKE